MKVRLKVDSSFGKAGEVIDASETDARVAICSGIASVFKESAQPIPAVAADEPAAVEAPAEAEPAVSDEEPAPRRRQRRG